MSSGASLEDRRWLILLSSVVSFFAVGVTFFAVPPLMPQLIDVFGLAHFQLGLLMGAISVPAVLLSIPLGAAIDRWPARAAGNAGLVLMLAGGLAFAMAPSYPLLLIGRLLFGIGGLVINLLLARLITASFANRELSLAMGIFNSVYPASLIVVFSLHPALEARLGWRGVLVAVATVTIAAIPLHNAAVPRATRGDSTPDTTRSTGRPVNRSLAALAVSWMLFFGAYASVFTFAPEWAGGGSGGLLVTTLIMWTALVLNPVVGVLIDRFGRARHWLVGGQLLLAGSVVMMSIQGLPPPTIMVMVGVAAAAVLTATYSLPGRLVAPAQVGFAFGFITAFSNLSNLLGPAGTGAMYDLFGNWALPWGVVAATAIAGVIAATLVRPPVVASAGDEIEAGNP